MAYSPSHGLAGFAATLTAGVRSIYCLSLTPRLERWDTEVVADPELVPDWFFPLLRDLNEQCQDSSGMVSIGFGFDSYTIPREEVERIFETARRVGAKVITSHWRRNNIAGLSLLWRPRVSFFGASDSKQVWALSVPKALEQYGLLGSDIILSHATGSTERRVATSCRSQVPSCLLNPRLPNRRWPMGRSSASEEMCERRSVPIVRCR